MSIKPDISTFSREIVWLLMLCGFPAVDNQIATVCIQISRFSMWGRSLTECDVVSVCNWLWAPIWQWPGHYGEFYGSVLATESRCLAGVCIQAHCRQCHCPFQLLKKVGVHTPIIGWKSADSLFPAAVSNAPCLTGFNQHGCIWTGSLSQDDKH